MKLIRVILWMISIIYCSTVMAQRLVTIRLVDWAALDEMAFDQQAIAEFESRYPNIKVLYEPNPGRQYEEKILTGLAANDPPDAFLLDSKLIPTFTNKKVLFDLTSYIAKLDIDTLQWFPNVLNIGRRGAGLYAFPKGFSPLMVYTNKGLFEKSRIAEPSLDWTWEDMEKNCKLFLKNNQIPI